MLVLSRQRDETIMIGDDIEITVVDIRGDKIRLGISAPARIAVHRKEVYEAIKKENEQAAQNTALDVLPAVPPAGAAVRPGPSRNRSLARPTPPRAALATPVARAAPATPPGRPPDPGAKDRPPDQAPGPVTHPRGKASIAAAGP